MRHNHHDLHGSEIPCKNLNKIGKVVGVGVEKVQIGQDDRLELGPHISWHDGDWEFLSPEELTLWLLSL